MKRLFSFALACLLVVSAATLMGGTTYAEATTELESIYAPYNSFEELYAAYMQAVQDGDAEAQAELLEIGRTSLQAEIEFSEMYTPRPTYDAVEAYWKNEVFPQYFFYGYFENRSDGVTLSLGNKLSSWSSEDKENGWAATYISFRNNSNWDNTDCMKEQFYCHARLIYSAIESEWNLEPWKTTINSITCN